MTTPPLSAETAPLISPECAETVRAEIENVQGAEIFFVGRLNRDLVIHEVEAYAFGNQGAVPALLQYARPGDVILHNHPSGHLEPSSADIEISSLAGERGIGSYIIDNDCARIRVVVKAVRPQKTERLNKEKLVGLLSPGGRLADQLDGYEYRPAQVDMLKAVTDAFNRNGIAVIEAATGTGKSMAYLLPAVAWSLRNKEKVVIATHTINLQEQLIEKDLPLLRQTLGLEFDAVLLKGRNNYLGRRKADYVLKNPEFMESREKQEQLDAIFNWMKTTRDGSLADLSFSPDWDVWERVMSESDNCLRTQCPTYQSCFFYNARRRAARAQVLVVNHHLLMADLALRAETDNYTHAAVLPPYDRIILDEAHNLEDVATDYFGRRFTRLSLLMLLRRLAHPKSGEGLLRYLAAKIHDKTYPLDEENGRDWIRRLSHDYLSMSADLNYAMEEATDRIAMALDQMENGPIDKSLEMKKRITVETAASPFWIHEIVPALTAVVRAARPFIEGLHRLSSALRESLDEETPENLSPLLELQSACGKIERQMGDLMRFLTGSDEHCRWILYRRRGPGRRPHLEFHIAPLDISREIRERILRRSRTIILTSATLTVERKFDYFLERIGAKEPAQLGLLNSAVLNEGETEPSDRVRDLTTLMLDTPFDYDRQVYVGVPVDMPSPKDADFPAQLSRFLARSLRISRGRAFVLFTSYALLNRLHNSLAPDLEADGIACLKQGTLGRTMLTEAFRSDIGSVLFATSSFWEGVDIPGEALSCVVLTRLPFTVPSEPIVEARVEAMRRRGEDPFIKLIVPRAVIRFRQGFGRLIRRQEDRGAVLICDRRLVSAHYGRMFLRSLPTQRIDPAPAEKIFRHLEDFYAREQEALLNAPQPGGDFS